ncbi:hypothetical protein LI90_3003 [Carbonactinospora thermoautotrophica]|uniref:Uncharacterized protein n=2 Tax=Carbonactinospora thermoautotrophica TaxID=1469144 RepID=A0A132MVM7_9ACTN|nr:hypothetical protein LI90_3003 [Carbonactinospora thermoautotrophica]
MGAGPPQLGLGLGDRPSRPGARRARHRDHRPAVRARQPRAGRRTHRRGRDQTGAARLQPPTPDQRRRGRSDHLADLRRRTTQVSRLRQAARYSKLGAQVPPLLRDLRIAAHVLPEPDLSTVYGLWCDALEAAEVMLYKLGYTTEASIAVERVLWAAERSGDPLRLAAAQWHYAGEFMCAGAYDDALSIISDTLDTLAPQLADDRPDVLALWGAHHLKAALVAARASDRDTAWSHWQQAAATAETLDVDETPYWNLCFGLANVQIYSVAIPVEMRDGKLALTKAQDVDPPSHLSRERVSHHWIDVARAHHYRGNRDEALRALLRAEDLAPQHVRNHQADRETVQALTKRSARKQDLIGLGLRMGIV